MSDDEVPKHRNSRKTRRWCKGKVGVEHKPKCVDYQAVKRWAGAHVALKDWKLLICTVCGKELDTWSPAPTNWGFTWDKKPDWVK